MKQLNFPSEQYTLENEVYKYVKTEESAIGALELLWQTVELSQEKLNKKDHKTNKSIKRKLREITQYKDKEKDSRVTLPKPQILLLEEEELSLLKRHVENFPFSSRISEDVDRLWDIIDTAQDYTPPKPALVKDG